MVIINDKEFPLSGSLSIAALLDHHKIPVPKGVALALNERVVSRAEWEKRMVKPGDNIILIKATQGG
jgi:sulfur carrier protein